MGTIEIVVLVFILVGAINMLSNIIFYIRFMVKMRDVISGGIMRDRVLMITGLVLITFFLGGYVYVGIFAKESLITGLIMFFGSFFVSLMIILLNRLIKTSKERAIEVAQVLVGIIDARGPNLEGHSQHVKNLMTVFYKYLPHHIKAEYSLISMEYAALLHDIGKWGVPEDIINKKEGLTDEEWEKMRAHPQTAVRLLRPIKSFDHISDWILFHHEREDGNGYFFKRGESIPYPSKMIAIADAYSAMTMGREYNPPKSHEQACEILKQEAGKQFDEELVDIFLSIPKEEIEGAVPSKVEY